MALMHRAWLLPRRPTAQTNRLIGRKLFVRTSAVAAAEPAGGGQLGTLQRQQPEPESGPGSVALQHELEPYADLVRGKRFVCTGCGKCCQGAGEVWANEAECAAMARVLGLSLQHFLSRYTKSYSRRQGWRLLKRAKGSQDCVFLVGGTKCSVYGARPLQCATYPWWPELMEPAAWEAERATVCEGIQHETALEVDPAEKGQLLRLATEQLAAQQAAAEAARQQGRRRPQQRAGQG